jgi:osmotically inducible protein OsmC
MRRQKANNGNFMNTCPHAVTLHSATHPSCKGAAAPERMTMPTRSASARWEGNLAQGKGSLKTATGSFSGSYSFPSRFESGEGTNPEELIAAAHAGCYAMALSHELDQAGFTPNSVSASADVHLEQVEGGFAITKIALTCDADVPDIDGDKFQDIANAAKAGCPVSKALAGPEITLKANLK